MAKSLGNQVPRTLAVWDPACFEWDHMSPVKRNQIFEIINKACGFLDTAHATGYEAAQKYFDDEDNYRGCERVIGIGCSENMFAFLADYPKKKPTIISHADLDDKWQNAGFRSLIVDSPASNILYLKLVEILEIKSNAAKV